MPAAPGVTERRRTGEAERGDGREEDERDDGVMAAMGREDGREEGAWVGAAIRWAAWG